MTRPQFYGACRQATARGTVISSAMASLAGEQGHPVPASDAPPAILLTTSCTTGWADWVHGELWLCPDGLLRLSLGLATTITKSLGIWSALAYDRFARQSSPRTLQPRESGEL